MAYTCQDYGRYSIPHNTAAFMRSLNESVDFQAYEGAAQIHGEFIIMFCRDLPDNFLRDEVRTAH
jgi:hypothetical protein